jgi:SAM-dependent methyltransferase
MVFSLGEMPLANSLLSSPDEKFKKYLLELMLCQNCSLVQLSQTVPPEEMFKDYGYLTSYSFPMVEHAKKLVEEVLEKKPLDSNSTVMEIGSNDGYLLQHYPHRVFIAGIDPSKKAVDSAMSKRIRTLPAFFNKKLALGIERKADVIHANNVLAHVPDLNDFVTGLSILLKDDGLLIVEVPYVCRMIDKTAFDTIYHEHVFYFSLTALENLFTRHGFYIAEAQEISTHGGSLRLWIRKDSFVGMEVAQMLSNEATFIRSDTYYRDFSVRCEKVRFDTRKLLEGRKVAGFGAAAKATIFLNTVGITVDQMEMIADETPAKQGKFIPGTGIPVVAVAEWLAKDYDSTLILAWNFAQAIAHKYRQEYKGKFFTWYAETP